MLMAADNGPFLNAEIISLTGLGKLRVTCNWLYSSLNCDPNDNSTFIWQLIKLDDQHIALSPANSCISNPIYASVRDDLNYYLQVQAPFSADWIEAIMGDETITFNMHDMSIASFNGFNGGYFQINNSPDSHDTHSGYRVRSIGTSFDQSTQWFIGVKSSLQSHIEFSGYDNSIESLQQQLANCNINLSKEVMAQMAIQLNSIG